MPDTNPVTNNPVANNPGVAAVTRPGRIKIQNYDRMGKLVKCWTTNIDHLNLADPTQYMGIPKDMNEFKAKMIYAGVVPSIPDDVMAMNLKVVQNDQQTFYVRLPNTQLMSRSEDEIANGGGWYELPPFYSILAFDGADVHVTRMMDFHDCRIGDYTISNCR